MKPRPLTRLLTLTSLLALLSSAQLAAAGDSAAGAQGAKDAKYHHERRQKRVRGIVVTGVNSILGHPFFSWGEPHGASFNFPTMGVYNPNGTKPLPLTRDTPDSALLASWVDPVFLALFGKPDDYEINPAWINVPLRDTPVNVDFALMQKLPLRSVVDAEPLELAQTEPAAPITLGRWKAATGTATIQCSGSSATIKLRMKHLIPNRTYTVWATMGLPSVPGSPPNAFPIPIGGAPNVFVTDEYGDATFKRWIKFCPLDARSSQSPMLFLDVQFNAHHQTFGAVVAPGFIDGNWPGIITFSHVVFPVSVELLDD